MATVITADSLRGMAARLKATVVPVQYYFIASEPQKGRRAVPRGSFAWSKGCRKNTTRFIRREVMGVFCYRATYMRRGKRVVRTRT